MKTTYYFSSKYFKNKDFFKISKTDDDLLRKMYCAIFSKTHLDASESAKNTIFCDVTKIEYFYKKCLEFSKEQFFHKILSMQF
jgi:hypothetical protein